MAREAAVEFARIAAAACAARGAFRVALSGGSTPRAAFEVLADARGPYVASVPWDRTDVFFGDERQVPPDSEHSNARMACEALLRHVPIPDGQIHRIRGENPDADRAAEEYEEILRDRFRLTPNDKPRFDLVLLGMGADGHTASLFPGSRALEEKDRLVVATQAPVEPRGRITLTLPVINAAAAVMVLVTGAAKGSAFAHVRAGADLPVGRVRPGDGSLLWLADRAAVGAAA